MCSTAAPPCAASHLSARCSLGSSCPEQPTCCCPTLPSACSRAQKDKYGEVKTPKDVMICDANEEVKLAILIVFMEDKCLKTNFGIFFLLPLNTGVRTGVGKLLFSLLTEKHWGKNFCCTPNDNLRGTRRLYGLTGVAFTLVTEDLRSCLSLYQIKHKSLNLIFAHPVSQVTQ